MAFLFLGDRKAGVVRNSLRVFTKSLIDLLLSFGCRLTGRQRFPQRSVRTCCRQSSAHAPVLKIGPQRCIRGRFLRLWRFISILRGAQRLHTPSAQNTKELTRSRWTRPSKKFGIRYICLLARLT